MHTKAQPEQGAFDVAQGFEPQGIPVRFRTYSWAFFHATESNGSVRYGSLRESWSYFSSKTGVALSLSNCLFHQSPRQLVADVPGLDQTLLEVVAEGHQLINFSSTFWTMRTCSASGGNASARVR